MLRERKKAGERRTCQASGGKDQSDTGPEMLSTPKPPGAGNRSSRSSLHMRAGVSWLQGCRGLIRESRPAKCLAAQCQPEGCTTWSQSSSAA